MMSDSSSKAGREAKEASDQGAREGNGQPLETASFLEETVDQVAAYTSRDVVLYALGVGCTELNYVHEREPGFCVFPTYPVVLPTKGADNDIVPFPSPTMLAGPQSPLLPGVEIGLEGERSIEIFKPLNPRGAKLRMRSKILGIHQRGRGALVETETLIYEGAKKGAELLSRVVTGAYFVGARNFKESGTSNSESIDFPHSPPDQSIEIPTAANQAMLYRLSGDYNAIHISPSGATEAGYPRPMLHPQCLFAVAARAVLAGFAGGDPAALVSLKARFVGAFYPGETLIVDMWSVGRGVVLFKARARGSDKAVLTNARAVLRDPSAAVKAAAVSQAPPPSSL